MGDVTRILDSMRQGDTSASGELLPLVYDELRLLAARRMARERPGHTLQPTALVHEAYMRLVGTDEPSTWESRGHFFGAAAEAMRRILIEHARRKGAAKRGGRRRRVELGPVEAVAEAPLDDLLALDEALRRLRQGDPIAAQIVDLRFFAGLTMGQTAEALGLSLRTAERNWRYARSWLHREIAEGLGDD